ncbi:MAG: hypothetical protein JNK02_17980 [Planctomycetes bacterium]|nr:hypothetical protein [Planctomycetota bacterium]
MESSLPGTLAEIEAWLGRGQAPTRAQVRVVLVELGLALLEHRAAEQEAAFEQVTAWIAARPEAWRAAIAGELAMAVTEHVRSVDPRWLGNPKYDLAYTVEARHRLEARLACAERLGLEVAEELLEAVARADARLAPHLADPEGSRPRSGDQGQDRIS